MNEDKKRTERILTLREVEKRSLGYIGRVVGVTRERVRQILLRHGISGRAR